MGLSTTLLASATPTDGFTGWVVSVMETLGESGAGLLVALENLFPPIPSEVILPLAGFSASVGTLNVYWAIICTTIGSLVGAWCLYGLGVWLGRDRLLRIIDWMPLVDVADMLKAEDWFNRHGREAVLFGRVIPIVRSLISIPAGLERMNPVSFTIYTVIGSGVWNTALVMAGFVLGENWSAVEGYVAYFQYVVIAVVLAFVVWYVVRQLRKPRGAAAEGSDELSV